MPSTVFTDYVTPITASWLNDVNTAVYTTLPSLRTSTTGSFIISSGTTAQRDATPLAGYFRFNTTTVLYEGYNGSVWTSFIDSNTNQVIGGIKTFSSPIGVAAATAVGDAVQLEQTYIAQDFRLTLTSGTPITTSDVTAATTIFCTPYKGNRIGLWNGTAFVNYSSAEMSLAIGTLASATIPQDVFCYLNAGVPTLELLAWTSTTTRATALAYQNGILVKSGDATRRYIGSFAPRSTTTTEDSISYRYLYNYYHRVEKRMAHSDATASWTYTTATWRQARADAANQINFMIGVVEDSVTASVQATTSQSAGGWSAVGIGLNSTTAPTFPVGRSYTSTFYSEATSRVDMTPALGVNYLAWLEIDGGVGGTTTWLGTISPTVNSGITGKVKL